MVWIPGGSKIELQSPIVMKLRSELNLYFHRHESEVINSVVVVILILLDIALHQERVILFTGNLFNLTLLYLKYIFNSMFILSWKEYC